ncbi:small ribosomal subunit biogenesis GTPase RsgA [Ectothiorhodospiraceae bacterium 2226]|nr:small ribosomal subunit biogenesis GTPase RsgA [Ectothiorhodospiraceae bacterium 2226]
MRPKSTDSWHTPTKRAKRPGKAAPDTRQSLQEGLVVASFGARLEVEDAAGGRLQCNAVRGGEPVVCGDRVRFALLRSGAGKRVGAVRELLPRRSLLCRPSPDGALRPMAANLDRMLIVLAPAPALYEGIIDRYLIAAEHFGIPPVLVVNKVDLLAAEQHRALRERLAPYAALGYDLVWASAKREDGLDALRATLRGHTSVFVGQSGVGKSSLVGQLLPETDVRVGAISEATGQGRHTTTTARLYHLPEGGDVIDSPGVREFSLWNIAPREAAQGFIEFRPYLAQCRFNDCTHTHEPGCGVIAAAERGEITPRRLASYRQIIEQP